MNRDNILILNKIAKDREALGYDVLNGSIGMMYFDDGHLPKNEIIRKTLASHINDDDLTYSSISGEKDYRELLFKWFFNEDFNEEHVKTMGTQGGTGAIFTSIAEENVRNKNNILLFPDIGWPNYYGIASSYDIPYIQYQMFDENLKFNTKGIIDLIDKLIKEKKHVSFIINDPCHNPTGYSMNQDEWDMLSEYLTTKVDINEITLIIDCAYLDFALKETKEYAIKSIKRISTNIPVFLCLSCSKTFSFYGLRCGELVTICKDKEMLEDIRDKSIKIARGAWSTPNHMAINTIIDVLSNKEGRQELIDEIEECKEVIKNRSDILLKEAKENGLIHFPYAKGFFITFIIKNAYQVSEELMKQDIYLSPLSESHLRVALCSIPTKKLYGLASKIKYAVDIVNNH